MDLRNQTYILDLFRLPRLRLKHISPNFHSQFLVHVSNAVYLIRQSISSLHTKKEAP